MSIRSKAAILAEYGKPVIVDEVDHGDPYPDQVVVQLAAGGICHSMLHRLHDPNTPVPQLLGHEGSGVVVQAGSAVTRVKEGDEVLVTWFPGGGAGSVPTQKAGTAMWGSTKARSAVIYTWAEHCRISEQFVVPVAPGLANVATSIIGCAVMTGAGAVTNTAQVQAGDTVAVFGAGGVGLCSVQAARNVGAKQIIAVDLDPEKLAFASRFGATHVVNAAEVDAVEEVRRLSDGGVDFALDTIGVSATVKQIVLATRPGVAGRRRGGTSVLVGVPSGDTAIDLHNLLTGSKALIGCAGGDVIPDRDFSTYIDWYRSGLLPLDDLVSRTYTIDEAAEAVDDLENRRILGRASFVYNR